MPTVISVIVTTYNWPKALTACLKSLIAQRDITFEIIIADDGSQPDTQTLIHDFQRKSPIAIHHVYHEDNGFRAGTIRNKAVALSKGQYLLFIDGDCIALPSFIHRHRELAEHGYFVPGNRVLLTRRYSAEVLVSDIELHLKPFVFFLSLWLQRRLNRVLPFIYLPFQNWRYCNPQMWQKAMTCNLGVWKSDFIAANGFDERYEGWGYEDSDLVIRLLHNGVQRKEGRFATPVLHLWHPHNDRSRQDENYHRMLQRLHNKNLTKAEQGVDQYLAAKTH